MSIEQVWKVACDLVAPLEPRVVFDVGANKGNATQVFLDALPTPAVFAFEPLANLAVTLRERFANESRIKVEQAALGEYEGVSSFHEGVSQATSSRFPRNVTGRRYYLSDFVMNNTTEVPLDTLDAYCERNGVNKINLLKLDTQGGEYQILLGANGLLSSGRIDVIATEFFAISHYQGAPLLDEIWGLLRQHGYDLFDIFCGPHAQNGQLRYGDAIFVSPGFRAEFLDTMPAEP